MLTQKEKEFLLQINEEKNKEKESLIQIKEERVSSPGERLRSEEHRSETRMSAATEQSYKLRNNNDQRP